MKRIRAPCSGNTTPGRDAFQATRVDRYGASARDAAGDDFSLRAMIARERVKPGEQRLLKADDVIQTGSVTLKVKA